MGSVMELHRLNSLDRRTRATRRLDDGVDIESLCDVPPYRAEPPERSQSPAAESDGWQAVENALDALPYAALLCDSTARLLAANATATELLTAADGISLKRERLLIRHGLARQNFWRFLRSAPHAAGVNDEAALLIPRPSGRPSYQMLVKALPAADPAAPAGAFIWSLSIADPSTISASSIRALSELYGLSGAETRLAARLLSGASLKEIAADFRVATSTLRSQLRGLLSKTGTRRQAELVRVLSAVPRLR